MGAAFVQGPLPPTQKHLKLITDRKLELQKNYFKLQTTVDSVKATESKTNRLMTLQIQQLTKLKEKRDLLTPEEKEQEQAEAEANLFIKKVWQFS